MVPLLLRCKVPKEKWTKHVQQHQGKLSSFLHRIKLPPLRILFLALQELRNQVLSANQVGKGERSGTICQNTKDIPATPPPLLNAGTSTRGKESHTMQESIKQCDFYGNQNMHYMANQIIGPLGKNWSMTIILNFNNICTTHLLSMQK